MSDGKGKDAPFFEVGPVTSDRDLEGILGLQAASRTPTADGFVTVVHTLDILRRMHVLAPSIIARDGNGCVVAYALTMPRETSALLPILDPMFVEIEQMAPAVLAGTADPRWYVMGQIAVAPSHRGGGVFDALYAGHRELYRDRYDLIFTEVATRNPRSLRAHQRVGFQTVKIYRDETDEWALLVWTWA
ncbi:MAG: hypothetical protein KIS79_15585 [Burkholderiales bacterium]|nr:hypothetical protein [Burkholderiales bacterium]